MPRDALSLSLSLSLSLVLVLSLSHTHARAPPPTHTLQGALHAYIPPNNVTKEGPKVMERGEIGWAGGGAGPDFFIYLGLAPADHFGRSHTVWGEVDGKVSLGVVEMLVRLPASAPRPQDMHMLTQQVAFTIRGV